MVSAHRPVPSRRGQPPRDGGKGAVATGTWLVVAVPLATRCQSSLAGRGLRHGDGDGDLALGEAMGGGQSVRVQVLSLIHI